jgi:hypothetical protein
MLENTSESLIAQPCDHRHEATNRSSAAQPAARPQPTPGTPRPAQVLQALAEHPTGPKTIPHLVYLAAFVNDERDTSHWLDPGDIMPTLLSVLRSLPTTCPPLHATRVCAAAVAALNNVFKRLHRTGGGSQFRSMLFADDGACRKLVRWGLSCPEAAEQLPRDEAVFVARDTSLLPSAVTDSGHPFWSPFTCCMSFLCAIATVPSVPDAPRLPPGIKTAITPAMVERVMMVGVQHPCGRFPCPCVSVPGHHCLSLRGNVPCTTA